MLFFSQILKPNRELWETVFVLAISVLFLIYLPMAVAGYYAYGSSSPSYIVEVLPNGPIRMIIEVMLLLHLVSAFPIITNPPAQYFEQLFKIPSGERERDYNCSMQIALCSHFEFTS